ncbi:MAG: hypothetical protein JST06_02790 [Bacteroidetes bacterium]|nr:hypothetical protein [Bacteroidota bacterium]MBS1630696.1 hypothetical protein [Bacteroidota bacterium]
MPLTITHAEWMRDTHSLVKPRSESLKKIDTAIQMKNERDALKYLTAWIDEQNKKGQDWHKSVRNSKNKIVEKLAQQLGYMSTMQKPMSQAEKLADSEAKSIIRSQIRKASQEMFIGRRVVLSNMFLQAIHDRKISGNQKLKSKGKLGTVTTIGSDAKSIATGANSVRSIAMNLKEGIDNILNGIPAPQHSEIIEMALGSGAADFAMDCAPLIGTLTSGGKTAMSLIKMIFNQLDGMEMEERRGDVRPGDAGAALNAIIRIIDDEFVRNGKEAAIHGSAFAAKAALLCAMVPGDSIVGAAEGLLMLIHNLYELAKKYKQMNAANEQIAAGNIDVTIFNTCPILGCYYICVQGDFTIMNFDVANMGKANWTQEVMRLKHALQPVKEKAQKFIASSSIIVEGMEKMQGVYQESMWHKISQPLKNKFGNHTSKPGTSMGSGQGTYQLPALDSGQYSQKELEFLAMFGPL